MEAFPNCVYFIVSSKLMERPMEPDIWKPFLIVFLVSSKRMERLKEPDIWKPF
jgi:hypothetical protein